MHDAKGRELKVGDTVLIPATITELSATEDYGNVSAKSLLGRRPDGAREHFNSINTAVMIRANDGDENDLNALPVSPKRSEGGPPPD